MGSHTLDAIAKDTVGQTATSNGVSVTVDNVPSAGIQLSVTARKDKGTKYADLT